MKDFLQYLNKSADEYSLQTANEKLRLVLSNFTTILKNSLYRENNSDYAKVCEAYEIILAKKLNEDRIFEILYNELKSQIKNTDAKNNFS